MMTHAIIYPSLPLAAGSLLDHVKSHGLHITLFGVELTNHMLMLLLAAVLMLITFSAMGAAAKNPVPRGLRNFFEAILSFLRTEVFQPALGPHTDRFVPFLWTTFFFILFANVLGLVPFSAALGLVHPSLAHVGGTATGNLAVTAALALTAFLLIHLSGIWQQIRIQMDPSLDPHHHGHDHMPAELHGHGGTHGAVGPESLEHSHLHQHPGHTHPEKHGKAFPVAVVVGFFMYWKNFVPAVPLFLWPLMFFLELIGALVKPFSLAVRLFANMLAGHLILGALVALVPVGAAWWLVGGIGIPVVLGSAAINLLEIFVAFLQAYIFTFLTTLFIAAAVAPEH